MGHSMKRKEDPRFIRGQGNYIDDIMLPGMLYMDIVRSPFAHAKIVKIDTATRAEGAGRAGGDHRRDAGAVQAALDADADVGHADGAADRKGDVPGAGGRGGDRHRSLRRRRRRRGGRRRVRSAAGGRRSLQGAGAGRAGAAHRQARQERQPHLALGGGRSRGDRQGVRRTRRSRSRSTSTSRASTSRRSRPAAASPRSTRRRAS